MEEGAVQLFKKCSPGYFPSKNWGPGEGDSFTAPAYRARIDFLFGKGVTPLDSGIVDTAETSDHHLVWIECEI